MAVRLPVEVRERGLRLQPSHNSVLIQSRRVNSCTKYSTRREMFSEATFSQNKLSRIKFRTQEATAAVHTSSPTRRRSMKSMSSRSVGSFCHACVTCTNSQVTFPLSPPFGSISLTLQLLFQHNPTPEISTDSRLLHLTVYQLNKSQYGNQMQTFSIKFNNKLLIIISQPSR